MEKRKERKVMNHRHFMGESFKDWLKKRFERKNKNEVSFWEKLLSLLLLYH